MKLTCYTIHGEPPAMRPAPLERRWMDESQDAFAYRCLPLNIANACGWEILAPAGFAAWWDGGKRDNAITIASAEPRHLLPISHFGEGVLTFHVNALFRTEPGWQLYVTGPVNAGKTALVPLTGIVESDWAPYTFTMNWRFLSPGHVVEFEKGEPFCTIFPIRLGALEAAEPEIRALADEPELEAAYRNWSKDRDSFNADLKQEGSKAREQRWQKGYFRGRTPAGEVAPEHRTRLRLRPFRGPGEASG